MAKQVNQGHAYAVHVGNIGTVYDGADKREASRTFRHYVEQSKSGVGRAAGESVRIESSDGTPVREYTPALKLPTIKDLSALIRAVKATIRDDYRADEYDTVPGICLTVGWNDKEGWHGGVLVPAGEWSYQTGDNSYSGGAYGYPHWAVVSVYRRSDSRALAREIRSQLADLASS
jgi:hypothetical protein